MQNHITENDLHDLGISLESEAMQTLLEELNEKVDNLIGHEIVTSLTPEDVDALAEMQDSSSEEEIGKWISEHVPDFEEIIEDNRNIVLGDFVDSNDITND